MTYRVEIRCDVGLGQPLHKRRCESLKGQDSTIPNGSGPTIGEAVSSAHRMAKGFGWKQKRRPLRNPATGWVCCACQEPIT